MTPQRLLSCNKTYLDAILDLGCTIRPQEYEAKCRETEREVARPYTLRGHSNITSRKRVGGSLIFVTTCKKG